MKNFSNNVRTKAVNHNINKEQVGELSVLTTSKSEDICLCGNNSTKPIRYDTSNLNFKQHKTVAVKLRNRFEPLS